MLYSHSLTTPRVMSKKSEYLSYEKIKKHATTGNSDTVTVKCYFNGLYWACPNPKDERRSKGMEDSYNQGYFIMCETIKIPSNVYDDQTNWNS